MQIEEAAGLGFGVTALLIATIFYGLKRHGTGVFMSGAGFPILIIGLGFVALFAFMYKSGLTTAARLIAPYYTILIPGVLLLRGQAAVTRLAWFRAATGTVFVLAGTLLVLSPSRPLWPASTVLSRSESSRRLLERARAVYGVYSQRADAFAPVRELLPAEERVIGLVASDDPETSLWKPYGQRRIVHVAADDTLENLSKRGIKYAVVNPKKLETFFGCTFADWLVKMRGEVVGEATLPLRVTLGPSQWFVVKVNANAGS